MWLYSLAVDGMSDFFFSPPITRNAPAMPSGFLVYCTADASARNSRCRETADWINRPKNVPMKPTAIMASPTSRMAPAPPPFLLLLERLPPPENAAVRMM